MFKNLKYFAAVICLTSTAAAFSDTSVPMHFTADKGIGQLAGNIIISETPYGLLFTPSLKGLTPGIHGFHVHQHPSCEDHAAAAGGHLDPKKTDKHLGPFSDNGHLGDLPALYVTSDGIVSTPVLAPRLKKLSDIKEHSLMIHEGGDNYSDEPAKLGGGGARMICGVIK